MTTFDETKVKRQSAGTSTGGQFATKEQSAPESGLIANGGYTPHQLGIIGLGPASPNSFAEEFDATRGERPLRPYFALWPGDDDEFFDAPAGAVIEMDDARRFELNAEPRQWQEVDDTGNAVGDYLEPGEMWANLFDPETGAMKSARMCLPDGTLQGDGHYYTLVNDVGVDPTVVLWTMHDRRGKLVSSVTTDADSGRRIYGIPEHAKGVLCFENTGGNTIEVHREGDTQKYFLDVSKGTATRGNQHIVIPVFDDAGNKTGEHVFEML
jgi:hypothetical protein